MDDAASLDSVQETSGRLDSWKEIAAYLRRQVRTVNLWEKTEGLPVHRHLHSKRGTVYAYKSELDEWRRRRALSTANLPRAGAQRLRNVISVLPFDNVSLEARHERSGDLKRRSRGTTETQRDAYEDYLRARKYWNHRTEESLLKAVHYFIQALIKDPELAVAYCGLGDAYNLLAVYEVLPPQEAMPLARAAAMRALELNRDLGEAHACLGDVSAFYDWDWDAAAHEYQRALSLNASYATAHHFYAYFLAVTGDHPRALAEIKLAHAYDARSTIISVWKGILLRLAGNYDEAIEVGIENTKADPEYVLARWALGLAYEAAGEMDLALRELQTAAALSGRSPCMLGALAYHQGVRKQRGRAAAILHQLHALSQRRYVAAYDLALVYLGIGDEELAVQYLQKAFRERSPWIVTIAVEPRMQSLATNLDFQSLVRQLRLPGASAAVCSPLAG